MTTSPYIRGDGPGHNPITEPPPVSDCQGNGWVVCTTITLNTGAIIKRRVNPLQWGIMRSLGYIEEIVPQANLDNLAWELGSTVVADPIVTPPDPPPVTVAPMDAGHKEIALELVSTAENSTLDWTSSYGYIEDIGDGRGYTAGICGFCSGTHDMLALVEYHCLTTPGNALQPFLPALRAVDGTASHAGLGAPFVAAWKSEATTAAFRAAQRRERDRVYFNPAVAQAVADGLHALGQHCYFDASILNGPEGREVIRSNARKVAKTPTDGGGETAYLKAWCDSAVAYMVQDPAHGVTDRIDKCQRKFLNEGKLTLDPPLTWTMYGDQFTITTIPATPTDPPPVVIPPPDPGAHPWFPQADWLWKPIPSSAVLDPNSAAIAAMLAAEGNKVMNFGEYNYPIYWATASTPRIRVKVRNANSEGGGWGANDIQNYDIPVDPSWRPANGSDAHMAIIDAQQGKVFSLWACNARPVVSCGWGGVFDLAGDGISHNPSYQQGVPWMQPVSRATGSGLSNVGGGLTLADAQAGVINHALVFSTDRATGPANTIGKFRLPATTTDGYNTDGITIDEGTRIQLDPTINLAAIAGITPGEVLIGKALQTYGAYCVDNGGARIAMCAQAFIDWPAALGYGNYAGGASGGYYGMPRIPWAKLRVLRKWDGS